MEFAFQCGRNDLTALKFPQFNFLFDPLFPRFPALTLDEKKEKLGRNGGFATSSGSAIFTQQQQQQQSQPPHPSKPQQPSKPPPQPRSLPSAVLSADGKRILNIFFIPHPADIFVAFHHLGLQVTSFQGFPSLIGTNYNDI